MRRVNASSQHKTKLTQQAQEVAQQIRRIYKAMDRVRSEKEREGGLTRPQSSVVELLLQRPGLSLKEISEALELSHGTVSGIVARLEKMELVSRIPDALDRRVMRHQVTQSVQAYVQTEAAKPTASPLATALERASPQERALIVEGLQKLEELLEVQ